MAPEIEDKIMVDDEECVVTKVLGEGRKFIVRTPSGESKWVYPQQVSEEEEPGGGEEKEPEASSKEGEGEGEGEGEETPPGEEDPPETE